MNNRDRSYAGDDLEFWTCGGGVVGVVWRGGRRRSGGGGHGGGVGVGGAVVL
jgi:hypothetical protein